MNTEISDYLTSYAMESGQQETSKNCVQHLDDVCMMSCRTQEKLKIARRQTVFIHILLSISQDPSDDNSSLSPYLFRFVFSCPKFVGVQICFFTFFLTFDLFSSALISIRCLLNTHTKTRADTHTDTHTHNYLTE